MFTDRKTWYCKYVSSSQHYLQIQFNPNQNSNKLLHGYQSDSEVYMKRPKTQKSQHNTEGKEQRWRTAPT